VPPLADHNYIGARMADYFPSSFTSSAAPLPVLITYANEAFAQKNGLAGSMQSGELVRIAVAGNP
jgi:hypothetical protein